MKNIQDKVNYWLELAEYDISTVKSLFRSRKFLYVGFLCHLTIEKSLKAFYWKKLENEPPYTHNLLILSTKSEIDKILLLKHKNLINKLMPLNIEARYPSNKDELFKILTFDYVKSLVKETESLYKWIKKQIEL